MPWVIREGKPVKVSVTVQRDVVVPKPAPVKVPGPTVETTIAVNVPDGTVQTVLEWVGTDRVRATVARQIELDSDNPRTTLIEALDRIV